MPILRAEASGQIDPTRTWVVTGRERHVGSAREGNLPYPHRALRTKDFLYIRNFAPERWPMGSPHFTSRADLPPFEKIERSTYAAFADMDASPTKAWVLHHFDDPQYKWIYDLAFGQRPAEELYDLAQDPDQVKNVAGDPAYATTKERLAQQLLTTLKEAGDPRVGPTPVKFELPPFTQPGK